MATPPRCTFIPPSLLQRVAEHHPDPATAACCRSTLAVDASLRGRRTALATSTAAAMPDGQGRPVQRPSPETSVALPTWKIHTAAQTSVLPGELVRETGDAARGDDAVDEAYAHTQTTVDFYAEVLRRSSFDGIGSPVTVTVHYERGYDNAFWDGQQLVLGDGDGVVFDRFTKPIDVLAHELAHAVTQFATGLAYQGQSGALNESLSDVLAILVKQRALGQSSEQSDWLIGAGIFMPSVQGAALRSMKAPGTAYDDPALGRDPQVATMDAYVHTTLDDGGVHINSGIANHAFYLAATALGGNAWERAGPIWYAALSGGAVQASTDFAGFALATIDAAVSLAGDDSVAASAVRHAWSVVGVAAAQASPSPAPGPARSTAPLIEVRRSGGFAGRTAAGQVRQDAPEATETRELLERVDFAALGKGTAQPDRFIYVFDVAGHQVTVHEQQMTDDLARLARLALG